MLSWNVNTTLQPATTWRISYSPTGGAPPSPIANLPLSTRTYLISNLNNDVAYTFTLNAMLGGSPILTGSVTLAPTDDLVFLPLLLK